MGVTELVVLLQLRVFLTGYTVAMVTYHVTKIIITCSPMIGHLFDIFILTSTDIYVVVSIHQGTRAVNRYEPP